MKYDVIVVGAGPAGVFACYELLKSKKKRKILLIDMGKRLGKRKESEIMSGFGGAGTFSDGKLTLTANLSHEKAFHLLAKSKYQKILDYVDETLTDFGVDSEYFPKEDSRLEELISEAERSDIELVVRKARHVGTDKLKSVMLNFQQYLLEKGVEFFDETKVVDLIIKENKVCGVMTDKGEILGKKVLLAPGRVNAKWMQNLAGQYGIEYVYDKVEVGVRVR